MLPSQVCYSATNSSMIVASGGSSIGRALALLAFRHRFDAPAIPLARAAIVRRVGVHDLPPVSGLGSGTR